jgi:hypothetical protein
MGGKFGWRLTNSISKPALLDRVLGPPVAVAARAEQPLPRRIDEALYCAVRQISGLSCRLNWIWWPKQSRCPAISED